MSETNGHPLDPAEIATLAPDDPRRVEFARQLADPALRATWEREWAQSDRLRAMLPQVEVPTALEARLLAIPGAAGAADPLKMPAAQPARAARDWKKATLGWRAVAALVVLAAFAWGLWAWQPWVPRSQPLAAGVRKSIAIWAVKNSSRPLEVASSDAEAVRQSLASHGYDFPVLMLTPSGKLTLEGGGACDFGPAKAVYTKWAGDGYTCTLYEFNGTNVGAPPIFPLAPETPQELWRDDAHYRVLIFPGQQGKCCWALVMDTDKAVNNFSKYTSGTY